MVGIRQGVHERAFAGLALVAALVLAPPSHAQQWVWGVDGTLRGGLVDERAGAGVRRVLVPSLQAAGSRRGPKTDLGFNGWLSANFGERYPGSPRDDLRYGLGVSLGQTISERLRLSGRVGYSTGPNVESRFATSVALSNFDLETVSAGLGMSYDVSRRTTLGFSASGLGTRYRRDGASSAVDFPGEVPVSTDDLIPLATPMDPTDPFDGLGLLAAEGVTAPELDYWNARFGVNLNHRLNSANSLSAGVGFRLIERRTATTRRSDDVDLTLIWRHQLGDSAFVGVSVTSYGDGRERVYGTQTFAVTASRALSPRMQLSGWLGSSYGRGLRQGSDAPASRWDPVGGVGVTVNRKRTVLSGSYSRSRYGSRVVGGSYLTDAVYFTLSSRLTKKLLFGLYTSLRESSDRGALQNPDLPALAGSYRSSLAGVVLQSRLAERTSVGINYSSHSFNSDTFFDDQRSSLTVFVRSGFGRTNPFSGAGVIGPRTPRPPTR